jgi:hypothetical protein
MADKESWKGGRLGAFHLGRRYKDIGADLGRVYEAHDVHSGAPAVVVMPGQGSGWEPTEAWRVRVSSHVEPDHVVLAVEQAPATGRLPELSDMLDLATSVVEHLEKKDAVRAHLTREPIGPWRRWTGRARRLLRSRWMMAASLAAVAVGVALWLRPPAARTGHPTVLAGDEATHVSVPRGILLTRGDAVPPVIAFPMPDKPIPNQAKPPCKPRMGEVEINGGCWAVLEKRPPCEDTAEYKGKCYRPVGESPRPPQSLEP